MGSSGEEMQGKKHLWVKNSYSKCSTRNKIRQTNNTETWQKKQPKIAKVEPGDGRDLHRSYIPGCSAGGIEK